VLGRAQYREKFEKLLQQDYRKLICANWKDMVLRRYRRYSIFAGGNSSPQVAGRPGTIARMVASYRHTLVQC